MLSSASRCLSILLAVLLAQTSLAPAQKQPAPQPPQQPTQQKEPSDTLEPGPAPPPGTVLFNRNINQEQTPQPPAQQPAPEKELVTPTDAERASLTFTAYDLALHISPATSHLAAHAQFTVKNTGPSPLPRLALQLSSTLHWESVTLRTAGSTQPLTFAEHPLDTDADHTGQATEAVITLPQPLAPGTTLDLTAIYSGEIPFSAERLERIGAPLDKAAAADWDAITPSLTALRGFGNVLWYPTASPSILLGDGAKLFQALGQAKLRQSPATISLRLTVEYTGEAPAAAWFCGRREVFHTIPENPGTSVTDTPGLATAEFSPRTLGFRIPSLFIVPTDATATDNMLLSAITQQPNVLPSYNAGLQLVRPLLSDWLGPNPLEPLILLDHPGQPFEDNALLVAPMHAADAASLAPLLAHSLTHAWFYSSHPWLNEGVAQFMTLLWVERNQGRNAALAQLHQQVNTLALAEPQITGTSDPATTGQSLIEAHDETTYCGTKSAAVLWMLRSLTGDAALKHALALYRDTAARSPKEDADSHAFQRTLEQASGRDLGWFFDDWVYRDRGLPDLSILNVTPRDLSTGGKTSWLVSVEVHNDGYAAAEVPITVRSGTLTKTEFLRLPGRATASTRVLFEGIPAEVIVNDGTIPEQTTPTHTRKLTLTQTTN
ncbi:M1 family aminopeptidase [Edaphobacter bradus]|uniref:M1 family aminopeptidase n=1 Tax=Edaphobacter bradus TaxID=2259016 RepID=UPI0021E0315B|nr:M1 family aminopeptidase [Edaphobacter bradus]